MLCRGITSWHRYSQYLRFLSFYLFLAVQGLSLLCARCLWLSLQGPLSSCGGKASPCVGLLLFLEHRLKGPWTP